MIKTFFTNKGAQESNVSLNRNRLIENYNKRMEANKVRLEESAQHYKEVLNALIHSHISQINSDTTPEQLEEILASGEKKWKSVCACVRKTNSLLTLDINAFAHYLIRAMEIESMTVSNPVLKQVDNDNANG